MPVSRCAGRRSWREPVIEEGAGDILAADVDAIVVPVNVVGVMGKGLALGFKQRYPGAFEAYRSACETGDLRLGHVVVTPTGTLRPFLAVHFPTKRHWREPSRLGDIESGLASMADLLHRYQVGSLAVPALGCGLGGLSFDLVAPLVRSALGHLPLRVVLFPPVGAGG